MSRQNPTTILQSEIIEYLNQAGHVAHRNQIIGQVRGQFYRNKRGVGDILCCLQGGRWLEIEIKRGKDVMSKPQIKRMTRIRDSGGLFWVVTSFEDFEEQCRQLWQ